MITSPYDTKACQGYKPSLGRLGDDIKKAYLLGTGFQHLTWDNQSNTSSFLLLPDYSGSIKPFGHPIYVEGIRGGENLLVADARTMFSIDPRTLEVRPKVAMNASLEWTRIRLGLQLLWDSSNFPIVQPLTDYPMMLYGKVMSEGLSRKYGLEPQALAYCDMLFVYAFWCFSHTKEQWEEAGKERLAHLLAMTIKSTTPDIANVINDLDYFYGIDDIVVALQNEDIVGTPRMGSITVATLFEIVSGMWYLTAGAPSQEIIACALEHPPTWMACVYLSTSNLSIKGTLSLTAQRYKRHMDPAVFVNGVIHLLGVK